MKSQRKKHWRPITSYFDLYGIEGRVRNQKAFEVFVDAFGWQDYIFDPTVYDFGKLLRGDMTFDQRKEDAIGFDRLPDKSFEIFGCPLRVFRRYSVVALAALTMRYDRQDVLSWSKAHNALAFVCKPEFCFHDGATLILFLDPGCAHLLQDPIRQYAVDGTDVIGTF